MHDLFGGERKVSGAGAGPDTAAIHESAQRGIATTSSPLPHAETIQRLFGRHDISGIQAHTGVDAAASTRAMGAEAYATGNHVVLGAGTDLHTVAHEAAHVVQQRAGVHLLGGVGEAHDAHERHADRVAALVVRGHSAEAVLDEHAAPRASAPAAAVQRRVVLGSLNEKEPDNPGQAMMPEAVIGWLDVHRPGTSAAIDSAALAQLVESREVTVVLDDSSVEASHDRLLSALQALAPGPTRMDVSPLLETGAKRKRDHERGQRSPAQHAAGIDRAPVHHDEEEEDKEEKEEGKEKEIPGRPQGDGELASTTAKRRKAEGTLADDGEAMRQAGEGAQDAGSLSLPTPATPQLRGLTMEIVKGAIGGTFRTTSKTNPQETSDDVPYSETIVYHYSVNQKQPGDIHVSYYPANDKEHQQKILDARFSWQSKTKIFSDGGIITGRNWRPYLSLWSDLKLFATKQMSELHTRIAAALDSAM
jgi:hypothetical protein